MLSIEVCRKFLGKSKSELTDEEIEETRDALYQIGTVLVNEFFKGKEK
jgi:hypothetical protein